MSPPVASSLANRLLVALPALHDPNFARSVTLLCQHDGDGAMGVVVNRVSEYTLGEVFRQMGIASDDEALQARAVLAGGPVHPERGFVIHDGDGEWDSSLEIGDGLRLTTSRDVLGRWRAAKARRRRRSRWVARGGVAGNWNRSWWRTAGCWCRSRRRSCSTCR